MSTDEITYAQEIIDAHSRRLHKLEVQSALHGGSDQVTFKRNQHVTKS